MFCYLAKTIGYQKYTVLYRSYQIQLLGIYRNEADPQRSLERKQDMVENND